MATKFRVLLRVLQDDGWQTVAQQGSHRQIKHHEKAGRVTVAGKPNATVPPGNLNSTLKQAGLTKDDLP